VSQTNLPIFLEKVAETPALQKELQDIKNQPQDSVEAQLAALSIEAGTPVTAEEFRSLFKNGAELSEGTLEHVTGGGSTASNVLHTLGSVAKVGLGLLKSIYSRAD